MAGRRGGEQTVLQRWAIIVDELGKVASASSVHGAESYAVEEAILGYNPRYANGRSAWSFQGAHAPPCIACLVLLRNTRGGEHGATSSLHPFQPRQNLASPPCSCC